MLGDPETLLADTGYFSAANVEACEKAEIEPLIAMGRQPHHPPPEGRKVYALCKQTPGPVFGIIKSALGFRQFSLRGLDKVRGEWSLPSPPPDEAVRGLAPRKQTVAGQ